MKNSIAFVTGGATGIGAAAVRALAGRGARVAVCDLNKTAGQPLADETGGEFIACDVTSFDAMSAAVATCRERLGVPDYALLNAGIMTVPAHADFLALEEVSVAQYRGILGVNLDGVFHGMKALLPLMREQGGAITVTASTTAFGGLPVDPLYAATKHALVGLVRSVAAANEGGRLRFNVICPGAVDTELVPEAFRKAPAIMPPEVPAADIVDLLLNGANGEVRARLDQQRLLTVPPPDLDKL